MKRISFLALAALGIASNPAFGEEFPGGGATSESEFDKGFGESTGFTQKDQEVAEADRLKIGGVLASEVQYSWLNTTAPQSDFLLNPQTVWLYFDSKLKNDVRGYVKLRGVYNPTVNSTSIARGLSGQAYGGMRSDVEEIKVLFNVKKTVFFTVGRQKIRWGSGKFWNPTDLLNTQMRNLLITDDRRSGVSLIKAHVPVGATNWYLIQRLDNADQVGRVQHAVRAEIPFSSSEIAVSASFAQGSKPWIGLDASTALGVIDVYGEVAHSQGTNQTFYQASGAYTDTNRAITNGVAGMSYDLPYADNDTVTFGLEYFRNGAGYGKSSDYLWVLANGGYQPFRLSQGYGLAMIHLPNPGSLEKVSFTLLNLANLTDYSGLLRLNTTITRMEDLSFDFGVAGHYGNGSGEFKLGGQTVDVSARVQIAF